MMNANRIKLVPTADQTFEIRGGGFAAVLADSRRAEREGDVERACNIRFHAFQRLAAVLPDDEETVFEWNDRNTRAAAELIYASAVDHFLIDDFEMSAALAELLLEVDPEDHCECTPLLAQCYVAAGEYDSFDDIAADLPEGSPLRCVLTMFVSYCREGRLSVEDAVAFRRRHPHCFSEFAADEHPADEAYLHDIESTAPTAAARARELWLQTENIWRRNDGFIAALKSAADNSVNI